MKKNNIELCKQDKEYYTQILEKYYLIYTQYLTPIIDKMKNDLVVNVIKHFTGNSYVKLKVLRQDLFEIFDEFDVKKIAVGSGEFRLNLTSDDYCSYHKSLVKFWDELYVAINTGKD